MANRDCIVKRIYNNWTPYIQVIGWVVIALPMTYSAFSYFHTTLAYGDDIQKINTRIDGIDAWKEKTSPVMAAMKQEIDDIHDAVVKK